MKEDTLATISKLSSISRPADEKTVSISAETERENMTTASSSDLAYWLHRQSVVCRSLRCNEYSLGLMHR